MNVDRSTHASHASCRSCFEDGDQRHKCLAQKRHTVRVFRACRPLKNRSFEFARSGFFTSTSVTCSRLIPQRTDPEMKRVRLQIWQ